MTQPNQPKFVRKTPSGNNLSLVQDKTQNDPTNGFGYAPMSEDNPEEILLNPPKVLR